MSNQHEILFTIPADDRSYAIFRDDEKTYWAMPIVAWAKLEHDPTTRTTGRLYPLVQDGGFLGMVDSENNYIGTLVRGFLEWDASYYKAFEGLDTASLESVNRLLGAVIIDFENAIERGAEKDKVMTDDPS